MMKKIKLLVFIVFAFLLLGSTAKEKIQQLKVLQLNLWHGTYAVPGGFGGLVSLIKQTDPDIVLFCELQNAQKTDLIARLIDTLKKEGQIYYGKPSGQSAGMISKYKIEDQQLCCYSDVQGAMTKTYISVAGHTVVVYAAHLDYTNYACYLPRGYSGTTWKKLPAPVLNADTVLKANRLSQRDETITAFIKDAKQEINNGRLILLGGDFNEPSHLDWQADTKNLRDHNGLVVNWDCSVMLTKMGMIDSYRKIFPDAVKNPGFTFPSANPGAAISKLTWAPEADERDRIDFIYYYPNSAWLLKHASIVGPAETISYGKITANDSQDSFIVPEGVWPTDHKGNLVTFLIRKNQ
ncbi:endonuclease/exonuclease/phosphatase family protein [Niabella aquatica]